MSDSRVEKLARVLRCNAIYAMDQIRRTERAGLVVLDPDDPEVIERVARAIAEATHDGLLTDRKWDRQSVAQRAKIVTLWEPVARTVLSALKANG